MAETLQEHVAQEIRAELARQRRSGAWLARELGVSEAWVSHRLSGKQITVADVERLAGVLGVSASQFFPVAAERVA